MQNKCVYIMMPGGNLNFGEIFFNVFTLFFSALKMHVGMQIVYLDKLQSYLQTVGLRWVCLCSFIIKVTTEDRRTNQGRVFHDNPRHAEN